MIAARPRLLVTACAAVALTVPNCLAAEATTPPTPPVGHADDIATKAGRIASQPARDVGIIRTTIPPVLIEAVKDPYALTGIKSCRDLTREIDDLSAVLGPDFAVGAKEQEDRAGKLAETGGKIAVNSLIPFRGAIREVSGAGPAQRRLNIAINAGYARRGFLRGTSVTRACGSRNSQK